MGEMKRQASLFFHLRDVFAPAMRRAV